MDGQSRTGNYRENVRDDSGENDLFNQMKSDWGDSGMFFEQPHSWGFGHRGMPMADDPGMDAMRAGRGRPKFHSFDSSAHRPHMFAPRPYQRERRSSGGEAAPSGPSPAADGHRERIIPIQIERDDVDAGARPAPHQAPQPAQQEMSPRQQKRYVRRGTLDNPAATMLRAEEVPRDARAQSAPPVTDEAQPAAAAAAAAGVRGSASASRVQPPSLNVQQAAAAAQQRGAHKPNYFNSSPKPFSPEPRPFQTPAFGRGQIQIPVQVERSGERRPGPKVAPKPQPHQHHQQQHHQQQPHSQQHHPQQQQQHPQQQQQQPKPQPQPQPEKAKTPPPPPQPQPQLTPKERAMNKITGVRDNVAELASQVDDFKGEKGEKQYLYLDEMLTRELIKLDDVEANGDEDIRSSRKDAIMKIQRCLSQLDRQSTPAGGVAPGEKIEETAEPMEAAPEFTAAEGAEQDGEKGEGEAKEQATQSEDSQGMEAEPAAVEAGNPDQQPPAAGEGSGATSEAAQGPSAPPAPQDSAPEAASTQEAPAAAESAEKMDQS